MRDGWVEYKFKDVATAVKGKLPKSKNEDGIGVPYLTASYLRSSQPDYWIENLEGSVTAEDGDCLILWDGAGAGDLFSARLGVVSSTMAVVTIQNSKILREFLTLFISSKADYIKETCRGTTVPHVSPDAIANMELKIPPLPEQKRIVDLISSVDSYIEALQQQLESAKRSRNAVLHELLTAGGDDWIETSLGEIAEVVGGGTPSTTIGEYWDGDIVWLTPTEITSQDGKVVSDSIRKITDLGFKNSGAQMLPKDSVILTSRASVGFVALAGKELCTNQGFQSLIPKPSVLSKFLMFWIQQNRPEFESRSAGSTFKEISKSNVKSIKLQLPPLPEQRRIVEIVNTIDEVISQTELTTSKAKNLRSGLLTDLLSGEHEIPTSYDKVMSAA
jgi:type I restriction enzyme, S subunit